MRVIVFSGVFDPVHAGHVSIVESALEKCNSAKAIVIAEKIPQHKHGATPYQHRHRMLELAFSDNKKVEVVEAPISEHRVTPFFTWLKCKFPEVTFHWLVGSDVIKHMSSWKDIGKLKTFGVEKIIVGDRNEVSSVKSVAGIPIVQITHATKFKDVCSSEIRKHTSLRSEYLHPLVKAYIEKYKLYT